MNPYHDPKSGEFTSAQGAGKSSKAGKNEYKRLGMSPLYGRQYVLRAMRDAIAHTRNRSSAATMSVKHVKTLTKGMKASTVKKLWKDAKAIEG